MRILGISEGSHDAAWCLIEDGEILEAHHQERHSRLKNDKWLDPDLLPDADVVVGHQFLDKVNERREWSGQKPIKRNIPVDYEYNHHETHAWAGWATAPFNDCDILTIDAVGEWDTATVHEVRDGNWKKTFGMKFPKSYGMPYSMVTSLIGYKPMQDEYITMAMSAYGSRWEMPKVQVEHASPGLDGKWTIGKFHKMNLTPLFEGSCFKSKHYIFNPRWQKAHVDWKGVGPERNNKDVRRDLARNIQHHYEYFFYDLIDKHTSHKNLIIMGGCALNCVANSKVKARAAIINTIKLKKNSTYKRTFGSLRPPIDNLWIMPNPGDAGSSLGAAARHYGKKLNWKGPYLGTEAPRMNPQKIVDELERTGIAAVCSGRAEFGPRALGNRSLLVDPRDVTEGGHVTRQTIDEIKKREQWRPFAPAILDEEFINYFDGEPSDYMSWTSQHLTDKLSHVTHIDKSARVQSVKKDCDSVLREVLELWFKLTGCPVLLNTSLNVKGEPLIDTIEHYKDFCERSGLNDLS
jgi:carbamoyltransferase